jgi:hypothetical protein
MNPDMSIMEMLEFAGQLGALMSYVQLIDTVQNALPRRNDVLNPVEIEPQRNARRVDGLQRNALGRKRRVLA